MSTPDDYDEDADFAAGFASTEPKPSGDTLALDDTPQPQPGPAGPAPVEVVAVPTDPTPAEADPFASLPAAVRDLLGKVPSLEAEVQTLRRQAGMVPNLQSKIDRLERERQAPPPQEATPPAAPQLTKVSKLREQGLDEIADAMDEIAALTPRATPAPAAPAPEPVAAPAAPADQPVQHDPVLALLDDMRPGWNKDLDSTDFKLWLSHQPADFQQTVRTTNSAKVMLDSLGAFDRFQAQRTSANPPTPAPTPAAPSRQLQRMTAAMAPRGDGRSTRAAGPVDDEEADFQAGFSSR